MAAMVGDLRQPLLTHPKEQVTYSENPSSEASTLLRILGIVEANTEITVSGSEIRGASYTYPSTLDIPNLSQRDGKAYGDPRQPAIADALRRSIEIPEEEELRDLLHDHVEEHYCCGHKGGAEWSVKRVDDCSSYVGTLETFVEEREVIDEAEPYSGGPVDGKDKGRIPDAWEIDMKAEIPLLFVLRKEARKRVPHSEVVMACQDCSGCGSLPSCSCKIRREFKHIATSECRMCSGLCIMCIDTSDPICKRCNKNERKISCTNCGAQKLKRCMKCRGEGAFLHRKVLLVRWRTILLKRVCSTKNAKSVPDEVFQRAKGVQLHESQSYQCEPACFETSNSLTRFSEHIIAERASLPWMARMICERHQLGLVPVMRVVMARKKKTFKFYIIGMSREIYVENYPTKSCWASFCGLF